MRTIKFRAKRIDNGEWFYGGYYQVMSIHFIKNGIGQYCKVDPKTVNQYTGLNDKNGKGIYEGDIVDNSVARWVVIFNKGCFCGKIVGKQHPETQTHLALRGIRGWHKVGNVFNNPELLK